jgi:hypothetical protein
MKSCMYTPGKNSFSFFSYSFLKELLNHMENLEKNCIIYVADLGFNFLLLLCLNNCLALSILSENLI